MYWIEEAPHPVRRRAGYDFHRIQTLTEIMKITTKVSEYDTGLYSPSETPMPLNYSVPGPNGTIPKNKKFKKALDNPPAPDDHSSAMKNEPFPRTEETLDALEEAICRNHGDLNAAARDLQVPARYIHMWGLSDPEAAKRIRQAQMIGWAGLESAAYQRAVLGVEEDVYYQGEVVGTKTNYSDSLLAKMLVARVPGYGEVQHTHQHMVNVNVMPRAASYEEWRDQRERELNSPAQTIEGKAKEIEYSPATKVLRDVL